MKVHVAKNFGKTAKLRFAEVYPAIGIVSIATYLVVELLLKSF